MYGALTVREAKGDAGHLILDANHRVIALCSNYADAIDLATAWNMRPTATQLAEAIAREAADVARAARTPQQEEELSVMRSRGEL